MTERKPHIMVLGLRDIQATQGGIETHVAQLANRLADDFRVTILARKPYYEGAAKNGAIHIVPLWCPQKANLETIIHSLIGVLYAAFKRPDILHIHAVGPCIVVPLARLFGLKTVATHHGKDYDREKWGQFARFILKIGERFMARFANRRIVISSSLQKELAQKYHKSFTFIPNGAPALSKSANTDFLDYLGLKPGQYGLTVGRLVPEKRQDDLIHAFLAAKLLDVKLVIAGNADHETTYSQKLRGLAIQSDDIVLAGFVTGENLRQLFSHARQFILPSSHEGLPIALLEAMQYELPIVASDISGNLEAALDQDFYFPVGDIDALTQKLERAFSKPRAVIDWSAQLSKYDWDLIAEKTARVYHDCLSEHPAGKPVTKSSNT
ncbi:glycosyltransferase family 4 protein [Sulfitobacter sp. 1151]|uniref:Glycosyltransferase family 4 protein n=1 Tax=Parasulfitobacter algicola TaxID=2614809 RepID=A0ABX2ILW1_9RHOB|nr:glycosyltransferase family 4 protein [Sulfitobacter algicola]